MRATAEQIERARTRVHRFYKHTGPYKDYADHYAIAPLTTLNTRPLPVWPR